MGVLYILEGPSRHTKLLQLDMDRAISNARQPHIPIGIYIYVAGNYRGT